MGSWCRTTFLYVETLITIPFYIAPDKNDAKNMLQLYIKITIRLLLIIKHIN